MLTDSLKLHTEYSGAEFNKYHKYRNKGETKFYKFLNNDLIHYEYQYKNGLNIDTKPFQPRECYRGGGLHFCKKSTCKFHWKNYGTKVALIEIPDDARVLIMTNEFKADRIIIKEIIDFENMPDQFWLDMVPRVGEPFKWVKNQTEEICEFAVRQHGWVLKYVKDELQTEKLCKLAVRQCGSALRYVNNQTEDICAVAVKRDGDALQYVNEEFQTENVCNIAVRDSENALQFVKNQTEDICTLAVGYYGLALKYVINQTKKICFMAVEQNKAAMQYVKKEYQTKRVQELIIQHYKEILKIKTQKSIVWYGDNEETFEVEDGMNRFWHAIVSPTFCKLYYVKNQTDEICKLAIQIDSCNLCYVENQTEELCKLAIRDHGCALEYIKEQTYELCKLAVQQDGYAIKYVKEPSDELCILAVKQNGCALMRIKNQTEKICTLAVQQDGYALEFVDEQFKTDKIRILALKQKSWVASCRKLF